MSEEETIRINGWPAINIPTIPPTFAICGDQKNSSFWEWNELGGFILGFCFGVSGMITLYGLLVY